MSLNKKEIKELSGLYTSYYITEVYNIRDLGRMRTLENKATRSQLTRLLDKFGISHNEEFN